MKYEQAQETLTSIATARRKTIQLRTYMHEGSIISVWGLVWLIGFSSQQFFPQIAYWFWLAGWTVAFVWTVTRPSCL